MNIRKNSIYDYVINLFNSKSVRTKAEKIAYKAKSHEIEMMRVQLCQQPCKNYYDAKAIINKISPKTREIVASYPKGTFKRVSKEYIEPITGKRHIIAYEGIKVDYDITTTGCELPKIRGYLKQP